MGNRALERRGTMVTLKWASAVDVILVFLRGRDWGQEQRVNFINYWSILPLVKYFLLGLGTCDIPRLMATQALVAYKFAIRRQLKYTHEALML